MANQADRTTMTMAVRTRSTIAQVNAGATLVADISGMQLLLVDFMMIAVGGNAATATTVDLLGTQSAASVKLAAVAIAGLTQSAVVKPDHAQSTVLAGGASFAACDANTAITIAKTGSDLATATHIDTIVVYTCE